MAEGEGTCCPIEDDVTIVVLGAAGKGRIDLPQVVDDHIE